MGIPLNIDWQQILLHLFNFTILFAILYFLLYSPVKQFIEKRQEYIKELENKANKNLSDAENIKAEYESKLNAAADEISAMKEKAQSDVDASSRVMLDQSKAEADKIVTDAKISVERERNKILADARNEITDIIAQAVEKVVINSDTNSSYDDFLKAVERSDDNE